MRDHNEEDDGVDSQHRLDDGKKKRISERDHEVRPDARGVDNDTGDIDKEKDKPAAQTSGGYSSEYASEVWTRPVVVETEKSVEEEMDSFFEDLLL